MVTPTTAAVTVLIILIAEQDGGCEWKQEKQTKFGCFLTKKNIFKTFTERTKENKGGWPELTQFQDSAIHAKWSRRARWLAGCNVSNAFYCFPRNGPPLPPPPKGRLWVTKPSMSANTSTPIVILPFIITIFHFSHSFSPGIPVNSIQFS